VSSAEKTLRYAALLLLLLGGAATVAVWDVLAIVLLALGVPLAVLSLAWEAVRKRHEERLRRPFEAEVDELLRTLFRDKPH